MHRTALASDHALPLAALGGVDSGGQNNASAYHASKWGLRGLSHALHAELGHHGHHGVRVTAVIAGGMNTPFQLARFPDIPHELLQEPDDVARAVIFAITRPAGTVLAEVMILSLNETSWP